MIAVSLRDALRSATARLANSDSARADAEILLAHVLQRPRSYLHTWPERALSAAKQTAYTDLIERRQAGEPVAYLCGQQGFWSHDFSVTPAVLIPRPDTELLVEQALSLIPTDAVWRMADLGTGSGALAICLALERPQCQISAVDYSPAALAVAQINAERLGAQVTWLHSDWFSSLNGQRFNLIVSNPPYIAQDDPHLQRGDLRYEPRSALASGIDGLDDLRRIISAAPEYLEPGGWLLLEHGYDQAAAVRALLVQHGYQAVDSRRDWGGHERISYGHRAPT